MFQSTPRLVSEGNAVAWSLSRLRHVSIHPPLGQRGERRQLGFALAKSLFQSTPRLVSEGNRFSRRNMPMT